MRTRVACLAVAAFARLCAPAAAQTVLTESDALARLTPDSPRVRAIRSAADVARADALGVGRWPNPRLNVDRESVAGVSEWLTTVLVPLPITGRRGLERDSAAALTAAAEHRGDDEMRRTRAELRAAYATLVAAQIRERELIRARDRLQELARVLEKREAAGDAAGFDRLRAEREALEVEADRVGASSARARAQAQLAAFFSGGTDPASLVAQERAGDAVVLPTVEMLVEHAERTRGDLLALQKEVESARLARKAADRRWIPEPEVVAGTKSSSAGGGDIGSVFGVQAVLPLFDRGQPQAAIADAKASQASARLAALDVALRNEIAAARAAAADRRGAASQYRESALRTTGELERIAQVSYDAGERGILELLDAYRTSSLARVRQAALDAAAREAEIELEFVSGWEIP
jgi:cobalt-zinc-cadmium efflux system outer membrane protein